MSTEAERQDTRKAMGYDLLRIFKQNPDKTYTLEELDAIIDAYLSGTEVK